MSITHKFEKILQSFLNQTILQKIYSKDLEEWH